MSEWWKGALIYQIYPRSFNDSNNDGVGDLPGITEKLDYVHDLGVDAIWISPFFKSPMHDFGYDIADYTAVDPLFGTLEDFRILLAKAHSLRLKVIIDQVISHSSDQHAWFVESRQNRTNPKADWYVWADPKPDGSPPNNWLSFFGGSAWTFDEKRQQFYLHNFLTSQPDLNFHNEEVQVAQLENLRFWLDLGVDGFRLDVANFYFHDKDLRNNPVLSNGDATTVGVAQINPYSQQKHIYDISRPENLVFLERLRKLIDCYPNRTTMGEINGEDSLALMAKYTTGNKRLHMAYTFDLLGVDSDAAHIRDVVNTLEQSLEQGWPCWALGNHDVTRVATRWGAQHDSKKFPLVAMAALISLHGSMCIYQGDELGLQEGEIDFDDIVDPYGKPFWPDYKGRDGCRTPMPWNDSECGGFSATAPWLPIDKNHLSAAVSEQLSYPNSTLEAMRKLICWRQQQPVLVKGSMKQIAIDDVLCWTRTWQHESVLVVLNFTNQTKNIELPVPIHTILRGHGFNSHIQDGVLILPPYQAFYAECE